MRGVTGIETDSYDGNILYANDTGVDTKSNGAYGLYAVLQV